MHLAQLTITTPSTVFNSWSIFLPTLVSRILLFAMFIAGLVFFIRLLIAGFSLLTAAGESAKIQSATKSLTNALIGLVVVISAFFIAQMIQTVFGLTIL